LLLFLFANDTWQIMLATPFINFFSQIMFAAVYLFTPEVYPTVIRTTAVGICSALSRVGGLASPFVASALLSVYGPAALYASAVGMGFATLCMSLLRKETLGIPLE